MRMMDHSGAAFAVMALYFLFLLAVYIAIAVANGYLAARLEKSVPLWVVLSLIPIVNFGFYIYVFYVILFFVIDRLKLIAPAGPGRQV
ncbi:MAG TPA: hypothetical protein VGQ90_03750 [Stellaceae bacterium]|jgi:hypothetical protein|nr:hypothetical protein [Stellaceae bacterium]